MSLISHYHHSHHHAALLAVVFILALLFSMGLLFQLLGCVNVCAFEREALQLHAYSHGLSQCPSSCVPMVVGTAFVQLVQPHLVNGTHQVQGTALNARQT